MNTPQRPPIVWSVAGSDSGAGAGIQADQRAFAAFGVHGCTAVTAVTAQNSRGVRAMEAVPHRMLDAQLAALAEDMPPHAVKVGMLGNSGNLYALVRWIDRLREGNSLLPVIVDPVLGSTTGASFADDALLAGYRSEILPRTTLLTPNRREAAALLGVPPLQTKAAVEQAAQSLLDLGCRAVVITGGDDAGQQSEDYAATPQARGWLSLARIETPNTHGTGCTFAATAAAAMANRFVEIEAIVLAKMATSQALRCSYAAGSGAGPVQPHPDFALDIANLPALHGVGQTLLGGPFAPLVRPELGLYAVVPSSQWVARVLAHGVRTVQLRIKDSQLPGLREEIRRSVELARQFDAQLFINDHWKLAMEEGAYGVHLGQEDLDCADLAAIQRAGMRLGVSSHAYWEVCRAWALRPSYIACGPIHATQAKRMPWTPQGNDNLAYWCSLLPLPVVAIAGMDAARAEQARECGAAGVAVISAITASSDPAGAIAALAAAVARKPDSRRRVRIPRSTMPWGDLL